jgi:hypothetical protein
LVSLGVIAKKGEDMGIRGIIVATIVAGLISVGCSSGINGASSTDDADDILDSGIESSAEEAPSACEEVVTDQTEAGVDSGYLSLIGWYCPSICASATMVDASEEQQSCYECFLEPTRDEAGECLVALGLWREGSGNVWEGKWNTVSGGWDLEWALFPCDHGDCLEDDLGAQINEADPCSDVSLSGLALNTAYLNLETIAGTNPDDGGDVHYVQSLNASSAGLFDDAGNASGSPFNRQGSTYSENISSLMTGNAEVTLNSDPNGNTNTEYRLNGWNIALHGGTDPNTAKIDWFGCGMAVSDIAGTSTLRVVCTIWDSGEAVHYCEKHFEQ